MSNLVQEILNKIEHASTYEDLDGWIWKAGDLIAKTTYEVYHSGFAEIDSIYVSPEEGQKLKVALLSALARSSQARFVSCILDCLIVANDANLKPLFVSYLDRYLRELKECNSVVYSALNGLARLGEDIYERNDRGGSSQSVIEVDKNIRQADKYLLSQGIRVSW